MSDLSNSRQISHSGITVLQKGLFTAQEREHLTCILFSERLLSTELAK